jgi:formylmethanofuran dehydrogenase subunit A
MNSTYLSVEVHTNYFGTPTSSIYYTARAPTVFQQQWIYARTNITLKNADKIKIKAQISDQNSVIAVDDVLVQSHSCEPMGWCDFESGMREKAVQ